jgi:hypothetical protein
MSAMHGAVCHVASMFARTLFLRRLCCVVCLKDRLSPPASSALCSALLCAAVCCVLMQDPQQYNSAGMARRIDGAIRQCMSLASQVQVRRRICGRLCAMRPTPAVAQSSATVASCDSLTPDSSCFQSSLPAGCFHYPSQLCPVSHALSPPSPDPFALFCCALLC